MRLYKDEFVKLAFGYARIEEIGDSAAFYKTTVKQCEAWREFGTGRFEAAANSTGVRLDFVTDSGFFAFKAAAGRKFDILVDGRLYDRIANSDFDENGVGREVALPEGTHRVTLVFPSHGSAAALEYIELSDGASCKPYSYSRKFLFLGDSITQGWHSEFDSMSYAWLVSLGFDAESVINGVGGGVFDVNTFDRIDFIPDTVIVAFGTNDFSYCKTCDELYENAAAFFSRIREEYPNAALYAVSPIWRKDEKKSRGMGSFSQCRETVERAVKESGFTHVDGYKAVPHLPEFFADDVHPNDLGFCEYARYLSSVIK